jgi:hypothetical protein
MMTRVWLFREGGTRTERADLDETRNVFARERRSFAGGGVVWVVVGLRALTTAFFLLAPILGLLSFSFVKTNTNQSLVFSLICSYDEL